jgi:hypothetical protein
MHSSILAKTRRRKLQVSIAIDLMVLPPCEQKNRAIGCQKTTTSKNGALSPPKKAINYIKSR